MRGAGLPIVLIVLGGGWLLHSLHWLPDVRWLWVIGMALAGVAILVLDGITKSSVVSGPLLILAALMSYLRLEYGLGWRFIVPVMLIGWGLAMLVARAPSVPLSRQHRTSQAAVREPPETD